MSILEGLVFAAHTKAVNLIYEIEAKVKSNPILLKDFTEIYAQARSMSIYHVLFIVSQFFQLVLCVDAVSDCFICNHLLRQIFASTIIKLGLILNNSFIIKIQFNLLPYAYLYLPTWLFLQSKVNSISFVMIFKSNRLIY